MNPQESIEAARMAAIQVLLHNARGPVQNLPRTAGWGYPEPYTRDMMISSLGFLASGNQDLWDCHRRVLVALAENQADNGLIPSLASDAGDLGASDTTAWFLIGLDLYRKATGQPGFLEDAARRAILWQSYQSPDNSGLMGQLPTSDWRDEQWVLGFGLYVNCLVYLCGIAYNQPIWVQGIAHCLQTSADSNDISGTPARLSSFRVPGKPYFALWSFKAFQNPRFDLLGNSLVILAGICTRQRGLEIVDWIEAETSRMVSTGALKPGIGLPPNLFPFIQPGDADWNDRVARFNPPGVYHNGGIWPFVVGFYITALVKLGLTDLAVEKLSALASLVRLSRSDGLEYGFNEWIGAGNEAASGQDWQNLVGGDVLIRGGIRQAPESGLLSGRVSPIRRLNR